MADKAVSELIEAERITSTDLFVLEQNGTAKKLTGQILLNWLTAAADGHGGIQAIAKITTSGLVDTYRITLADTTTFDFVVTNGRSITSIDKTATNGLMDTYTITYNDATTTNFTVINGEKGNKGDNAYIWIKYASQEPTESSHSIGDLPDDWIGIYAGDLSEAPTDWKQYRWYQIKGEKGDTGNPATLNSSSVEYQVSDSGTVIPSGNWSESVPVVAQGKYLWTRTTNTFNTGSPVVAYSVSRMGLDGSGSVSSVANISPDGDGNVPLTAENIGALPNTGGDLTGELKMNGQPISGLNVPTANDQAANMGFVNQQVKKAAPRNLLDNSDFTNPVNQRGQSSYSGRLIYTIDRWRIGHSSNLSNLVLSGDGITLSSTEIYAELSQNLENYTAMKGKQYTIAYGDSNGNVYSAVFTMGGHPVNLALGDLNFLSVDARHVMLRTNGADESVTLSWIALYEGEYTAETLPEYQPKGYGAELVECQRYYENSWHGTSMGNEPIYVCAIWSSNAAEARIPYKQCKRVAPTVTFHPISGYDNWRIYNQSNYRIVSQVHTSRNLLDALTLRLVKDTTNDTSTWTLGTAATAIGHWEASADL